MLPCTRLIQRRLRKPAPHAPGTGSGANHPAIPDSSPGEMMASIFAFPSWAEAYREWCVLNAIGWRLGPITPNNNGIFTFTAEEPR
jgi:hypothetical protein